MKTMLIWPALGLTLTLLAGCSGNPTQQEVASAQAPVKRQPPDGPPPGDAPPPPPRDGDGPRAGKRPHGPPSPERMIEHFDANGDGKLQVTELPERMADKLGKADTNNDGVLSVDEIKADFQKHAAERFAREDKNGDKLLDADELGDRFEHMKVADANGDGKLSQQEIEDAIKSGKLRPPPHHGRRGEFRGPPPGESDGAPE